MIARFKLMKIFKLLNNLKSHKLKAQMQELESLDICGAPSEIRTNEINQRRNVQRSGQTVHKRKTKNTRKQTGDYYKHLK